MTRGNQRERDRKKNEKAQKSIRTANTLSGTEFARKKEDDAAKMRAKQAAADAKKAAAALAAAGKKK
ncbi:4F5 domain protein [Aspergillus foveolatus]|jgi:protein-disulfide isomerase-like protein with CxxC motif|uniref:4F5 domain protein n=1 Tax=Aspergillus foveolatus TaxID=210207 RepID=UPI003CCD5149